MTALRTDLAIDLQTHPRIVREALDLLDDGVPGTEVARRLLVGRKSVRRWRTARRRLGPSWPDPADDAAWEATRRRRDLNAAAKRDVNQRYLERKASRGGEPLLVDATVTHRKIRALMRMGWSSPELGRRSRRQWRHRNAVRRILDHPTVTLDTAAAVDELFRELVMTVGPSRQTAKRAELAGWPGPLEWDDIDDLDEVPVVDVEAPRCADCRVWQYLDADLVLVGRALAGDRLELNAGERCRAFELGASRGRSLAELERVLHTKADRYYHLPRKTDAA